MLIAIFEEVIYIGSRMYDSADLKPLDQPILLIIIKNIDSTNVTKTGNQFLSFVVLLLPKTTFSKD